MCCTGRALLVVVVVVVGGWVRLARPEQGSQVGMQARGIKVRRNKRMFDDMRRGDGRSRWQEMRPLEVKYA